MQNLKFYGGIGERSSLNQLRLRKGQGAVLQ